MTGGKLNAYEGTREPILFGEIVPGYPMPEEMLADRLNIGRTPVRDALQQFETGGVVERRQNRRIHLADASPKTAVEKLEVRARREVFAERIESQNVDDDFLSDLRKYIDVMNRAASPEEVDRRLYREQNKHSIGACLCSPKVAPLRRR